MMNRPRHTKMSDEGEMPGKEYGEVLELVLSVGQPDWPSILACTRVSRAFNQLVSTSSSLQLQLREAYHTSPSDPYDESPASVKLQKLISQQRNLAHLAPKAITTHSVPGCREAMMDGRWLVTTSTNSKLWKEEEDDDEEEDSDISEDGSPDARRSWTLWELVDAGDPASEKARAPELVKRCHVDYETAFKCAAFSAEHKLLVVVEKVKATGEPVALATTETDATSDDPGTEPLRLRGGMEAADHDGGFDMDEMDDWDDYDDYDDYDDGSDEYGYDGFQDDEDDSDYTHAVLAATYRLHFYALDLWPEQIERTKDDIRPHSLAHHASIDFVVGKIDIDSPSVDIGPDGKVLFGCWPEGGDAQSPALLVYDWQKGEILGHISRTPVYPHMTSHAWLSATQIVCSFERRVFYHKPPTEEEDNDFTEEITEVPYSPRYDTGFDDSIEVSQQLAIAVFEVLPPGKRVCIPKVDDIPKYHYGVSDSHDGHPALVSCPRQAVLHLPTVRHDSVSSDPKFGRLWTRRKVFELDLFTIDVNRPRLSAATYEQDHGVIGFMVQGSLSPDPPDGMHEDDGDDSEEDDFERDNHSSCYGSISIKRLMETIRSKRCNADREASTGNEARGSDSLKAKDKGKARETDSVDQGRDSGSVPDKHDSVVLQFEEWNHAADFRSSECHQELFISTWGDKAVLLELGLEDEDDEGVARGVIVDVVVPANPTIAATSEDKDEGSRPEEDEEVVDDDEDSDYTDIEESVHYLSDESEAPMMDAVSILDYSAAARHQFREGPLGALRPSEKGGEDPGEKVVTVDLDTTTRMNKTIMAVDEGAEEISAFLSFANSNRSLSQSTQPAPIPAPRLFEDARLKTLLKSAKTSGRAKMNGDAYLTDMVFDLGRVVLLSYDQIDIIWF